MAGTTLNRPAQVAAAVLALTLFASADGPKAANSAIVAESRPLESWKQRHDAFVRRSKAGNVDVLFAGDSLTQRWESDGKAVWEAAFAKWKPANLGIGGDRTQHLLWRVTAGKELVGIDPKVIVLLIGTNNLANNSPVEIAAGVQAIVREFRKQKPEAQILLLGLFPRGGKPVPEGVKAAPPESLHPKVAVVNALLAEMEDDTSVTFIDLGDRFLDGGGNLPRDTMPDYLHLSADGYGVWAEAIAGPIGDLMNHKPSLRRRVKATWRRVDGSRGRLMMWMSNANR